MWGRKKVSKYRTKKEEEEEEEEEIQVQERRNLVSK
jgi:hypothetical protein